MGFFRTHAGKKASSAASGPGVRISADCLTEYSGKSAGEKCGGRRGGAGPALLQTLPGSRSKQVSQISRPDPGQVRLRDSAGSGALPPFALWNQGRLGGSPRQVGGGGEQANCPLHCSSLGGQVGALGRPHWSTPHDFSQAALHFSLPVHSLHFPDLNVQLCLP